MTRRKQHAPKRAAAYDSEDPKDTTIRNEVTEGEHSESREKPQDNNDYYKKELPLKIPKDELCTSTAKLSENDNKPHIPESTEPISNIGSTSSKTRNEAIKDNHSGGSEKLAYSSDSLEQIKAIYKSFLSNSYWSSVSLNPSQSCAERTSEISSSSSSCSSSSSTNSSPGGGCFDWHQSAVAKTLQQVSEKQFHPSMEPSLFSTVQLYRQSTRLYGSIFTGASKFHCKSCSASYDTLVDLTVHMNDTGHYRDDNHEKSGKGAKTWSKPRKRSLLEMEGKEDAQKVLRCMYCGHSFESLQDLSVHMIKTKHYQKVPLKEPGTAISGKIISSFKKRVPVELNLSKLNAAEKKISSKGVQGNDNIPKASDNHKKDSLTDQNEMSSSSFHLKSQILKCMECGNSYESLQQLTAHMMLTGHFFRTGNSLRKTDECLLEQIHHMPAKVKTIEEKTETETTQDASSSSSSSTTGIINSHKASSPSPIQTNISDDIQGKILKESVCKEPAIESNDADDRYNISSKLDYLTEDDLKESPKVNLDILKSLENTVTSAINKAQKGTPTWGGYQSIHAAYQLQNTVRPCLYNSGRISSINQLGHGMEIQPSDRSRLMMSPNALQETPSPTVNLYAMEELVKKVTDRVVAVEEQKKNTDEVSLQRQFVTSPSISVNSMKQSTYSSPTQIHRHETQGNTETKVVDSENHRDEKSSSIKCLEAFAHTPTSSLSLCDDNDDDGSVITSHPEAKQPFLSPLNALQSVMNLHLGKAAKPVKPVQDPISMLLKMSNTMAERAAVAAPSIPTSKHETLNPEFHQIDKDQPIDLSKGRGRQCLATATLPGKSLNSSLPAVTRTDLTDIMCTPVSPVHENALSDISDMLRNLSETHPLKPQAPSLKVERSEIEGAHTPDEGDDASMVHKRKGRQSHWNPQHLLILQAQFTSCLRQTADGKYVISDLSPQERTVISRVTGLSMTTISHWLANVKYQLRRTGRTKFLKNVDSGQPVFFCSECAIQIQTRSTYLCHLESHLGFRMRDLARFSCENLNNKKIPRHSKDLSQKNTLSSPARAPEQLYPI
ncbi:teashirt homolog 3 [Astyanax mexicanus]|uniref:teashirt homolog 3 n=1 Tax=Astyanax mexicanus TaxID=7994 RepID=UPI0020CB610C|nr:teashirt homolog 3 [Astyanax mexicanus]